MVTLSGLCYPNRFGRLFMLAVDHALGKGGLDAVVSLAGLTDFAGQLPPDNLKRQFDFAYLTAINIALEDMYGVRGGRSMALRAGRTWFTTGLKDFGLLAGLTHPAFQALPLDKRAEMSLGALAAVFASHTDQVNLVEQDAASFYFIVQDSPMAWGRSSDKPACHAFVGMLQGVLHYATGGYEYHVYEKACKAAGHDRCVFAITRKPIGQLGS